MPQSSDVACYPPPPPCDMCCFAPDCVLVRRNLVLYSPAQHCTGCWRVLTAMPPPFACTQTLEYIQEIGPDVRIGESVSTAAAAAAAARRRRRKSDGVDDDGNDGDQIDITDEGNAEEEEEEIDSIDGLEEEAEEEGETVEGREMGVLDITPSAASSSLAEAGGAAAENSPEFSSGGEARLAETAAAIREAREAGASSEAELSREKASSKAELARRSAEESARAVEFSRALYALEPLDRFPDDVEVRPASVALDSSGAVWVF